VSPTDETFSLEPTAPRHGRQLYARPLKDYQVIYGTKLRQIKNWIAAGREKQPADLPPLDDPAALPAWWSRHYERTVPEKLIAASAKAQAGAQGPAATAQPHSPKNESPTAAPAGVPSPAGAPAPEPPRNPRATIEDFDKVTGLDLAAGVDRLKKALSVVVRDYEQALANADTDDATLSMRAARVDKCMERLRKMEGTLDEIRKSREELIDRAAAAEDLRRVHSAMATSLAGGIVDRFGLDRAAVLAFVDHWYGALRQSRFFSDSGPDSATPANVAA